MTQEAALPWMPISHSHRLFLACGLDLHCSMPAAHILALSRGIPTGRPSRSPGLHALGLPGHVGQRRPGLVPLHAGVPLPGKAASFSTQGPHPLRPDADVMSVPSQSVSCCLLLRPRAFLSGPFSLVMVGSCHHPLEDRWCPVPLCTSWHRVWGLRCSLRGVCLVRC